jgi:RHS repeat-associated protein
MEVGKENDLESGLGDFGVRKYSPEIGRFSSIDPLWEKYYGWTPYHYCGNDPVNAVDGNGKSANWMEIKTSMLHPISAFVVNSNATKAMEMSEKSGFPGPWKGAQDAIRHTLWNAMNARDIGSVIAKKFADAHEYGQPDNADKRMDLVNNKIGRKIGKDYPDATDTELLKIVIKHLKDGKLEVLVGTYSKSQKANTPTSGDPPYEGNDNNYNGEDDFGNTP